MAQVADDEKATNGELSKTFRYTVEAIDASKIDVNSTSSPCMTLNFTHKKNRQIYQSTLSVADCKELIEKVPMMQITGLLKLLSDALSEKPSERLAVNWRLSENEEVLNIDVVRKSADEYVPDMVFALKLTAKSMDLVDKLQLRVEELEQTIETLQEAVAKKHEKLSNAVYSNADTGPLNNGAGTKEVAQLELPQKAGKFLVRYSVEAYGTSAGGWWIYYAFTLGGTRVLPQAGGVYLHANCNQSYGFPLSQSLVITLNGNESAQQRKLVLQVQGYDTYQAGMKNACIEYHELSN